MQSVRMSLQRAHALAMRCLTQHGADAENARAVADIVTAAERDLCHSHGLFRIPGYVASLKSGKVNGKAQPAITVLAPSGGSGGGRWRLCTSCAGSGARSAC